MAGITWADTRKEAGGRPEPRFEPGKTVYFDKMLSKTRYSNPGGWMRVRGAMLPQSLFRLIVEGKTTGALTMYAPEPDAFDEQEVVLLSKSGRKPGLWDNIPAQHMAAQAVGRIT